MSIAWRTARYRSKEHDCFYGACGVFLGCARVRVMMKCAMTDGGAFFGSKWGMHFYIDILCMIERGILCLHNLREWSCGMRYEAPRFTSGML